VHFHIITLFPKSFDSYLGESILKRALTDGKIKVSFYNPRDFADNKWKRIDRPPYGGGPGLVIEALPVVKAIAKAKGRKKRVKIVFLSPGGKQFTNEYASKIAKSFKEVIIVCGRYEGIDSRVKKILKMDEISVGPFVLTGGELPAMLIVDVMARQVAGVLGNIDSIEERRIASHDVYTRPEVLEYKGKKYKVPKVLLSGHQAKIEEWKKNTAK
jgi:tRNA (guanine37-N1)-methyltransferase